MKKVVDTIYKILSYAFLAVALFIVLVLISSALPIPGGIKAFVVQSGSMEPAVKTGSVVVVKPVSNYQVGDIITFGPFSKIKPPTTHRIVEIKNDSGRPVYITKGDANNSQDMREVRGRDVIGKTLFSMPYIGYGVAAAKKPIGFAVLVILPALILMYDEGKKVWQEIAKLRNKKKEETKVV